MLKFKVKGSKEQMAVTYSCDCGCTPSADYRQGSGEAGHEHCCCGKVHFAGHGAVEQMEAYLTDRRQQGLDDGLEYVSTQTEVKAPWGEKVSVAYALPYVHGEPAPVVPGHEHNHDHAHSH